MDPASWIFENNNAPQHGHQHGFNTDHNFLNFDSPSNNSDVSSLNNNPNQAHTPSSTSQNGITSNRTPSHTPTHQSNADEFQEYLNNNSSIDILEANLSHLNQHQHTSSLPPSQKHHSDAKSVSIAQPARDGTDISNWSNLPDFNDIDMNFFPNEIVGSHLDDQQHSQQQQIHHHQHHNNHNHHHHHNSISQGSTPIPPPTPQFSEGSAFGSAHNSSYLQNFQSPLVESSGSSNQLNSIRPDVVFTPLVSPAVTPMDALVKNGHHLGNPSGGFFSPLTSPALEAKSPVKLKKSSSPEDPNTPGSAASSTSIPLKKFSKRKTPGNTPIVGPTIPGRIAKQSPIIKAKRSSSYATNITIHHQQQQQQQQQLNAFNETTNESNSNDNEVMAPPKTRRTRQSHSTKSTPLLSSHNPSISNNNANSSVNANSNSNSKSSNSSQPATPATLMNFKMEQSSSPVILPSSSSNSNTNSNTNGSISRRTSNSTILPRKSSISSSINERSNETYDEELDSQDPATSSNKKTSHKLAEQGRRNRMNQAIQDLGALIPEELTATVTIPSKATTVELASQYIKTLLGEIGTLRDRLNGDSVSNESISPLETTNHH